VRAVFGRPLKLPVAVSDEVGESPTEGSVMPAAQAAPGEDVVSERALANPEVQRFREAFPGSKVYKVRNLKE